MADGLRTRDSLEGCNTGQGVPTGGDIKCQTRGSPTRGHDNRRRMGSPKHRRRAKCNPTKNNNGIGTSPKGYGQNQEDLRTNGPRRIQKTCPDIQRKRVASIPTRETMGSRYRTLTQRSQVFRLQDIPYGEGRRRLATGIHQGTAREGVHQTIKIPLRLTILLYQEERRKAKTGPRLSKAKFPNRQEPISPTGNPRANRLTSRRNSVHQAGYSLGIQQRTHKRGRSRERSFQDKFRAIRTLRHVLRTDKLPEHLSNHDGHYISRPHCNRGSSDLHGRYPHRDLPQHPSPPTTGASSTGKIRGA